MSREFAISRRVLGQALAVAMFGGAAAWSQPASAIDMMAAYQAALKNDPNYRAAYFENEAVKENKVMGRSGLLPVLQTSYSATKNRADTETTVPSATGDHVSTTHPQYISRSAVISLRQPLLNYDATARYRSAVAQSKAGEAQFASSTQEVAVRVVGAYLDALFASEQVALSQAQHDAYEEQAKVNQRMFEKGEASRTDMLETQARLELARAQLIETKDNQQTAFATLAGVIGQDPGTLAPLTGTIAVEPETATLEDWKKLALTNSPDLQYLALQVDIAKEEINKGRAGHMPRVDAVASYGKQAAETIATSNQENLIRSIGVQISMPLYNGGYYSAATRQAVANLERAKANLQAATDKELIEVRKQFALVTSGASRVAALTSANESSKQLVKATEQSIKGGVRINLDLLNAQQQMYSSQRDLAQARYTYLLSGLKLRAAAGTLAFDDVRRVANYFK